MRELVIVVKSNNIQHFSVINHSLFLKERDFIEQIKCFTHKHCSFSNKMRVGWHASLKVTVHGILLSDKLLFEQNKCFFDGFWLFCNHNPFIKELELAFLSFEHQQKHAWQEKWICLVLKTKRKHECTENFKWNLFYSRKLFCISMLGVANAPFNDLLPWKNKLH